MKRDAFETRRNVAAALVMVGVTAMGAALVLWFTKDAEGEFRESAPYVMFVIVGAALFLGGMVLYGSSPPAAYPMPRETSARDDERPAGGLGQRIAKEFRTTHRSPPAEQDDT